MHGNLHSLCLSQASFQSAFGFAQQPQCRTAISVLQEGKVKEQGTHAQLMEQQGLYYELWTKQEWNSGPDAEESSNLRDTGSSRLPPVQPSAAF